MSGLVWTIVNSVSRTPIIASGNYGGWNWVFSKDEKCSKRLVYCGLKAIFKSNQHNTFIKKWLPGVTNPSIVQPYKEGKGRELQNIIFFAWKHYWTGIGFKQQGALCSESPNSSRKSKSQISFLGREKPTAYSFCEKSNLWESHIFVKMEV